MYLIWKMNENNYLKAKNLMKNQNLWLNIKLKGDFSLTPILSANEIACSVLLGIKYNENVW